MKTKIMNWSGNMTKTKTKTESWRGNMTKAKTKKAKTKTKVLV